MRVALQREVRELLRLPRGGFGELYLSVATAALRARRAAHRKPHVWRMPAWPVVPVLAVAVLAYVLVEQSVLVVSALYWWGYLRRRPGRWVVTVPGEQLSPCGGPAAAAARRR
ncbi:hypothetical protein ACWEVP_47070 [Amycolatopsis sp. NPDC003865]